MLSVMEIIIALKKISLFSNVHGEGLKRLSDVIRDKEVSQGETVFSEKDLGEEMYLVYSGKILIFQELSGEEEHLEIVGRSEYFGEMAIVDEEPRSASARAVEDSTLLVLQMDDFRTAVRDYPDIAFEVFREFSRRIRRADERLRLLAEELRRKRIESP